MTEVKTERPNDSYFGWEEESITFTDEPVIRGGPGSGHHGHEGRPGEVGGSQPSKFGGFQEKFPRDLMDQDREAIMREENESVFYYTENGDRFGPFGGDKPFSIKIPDGVEADLDRLHAEGIDTSVMHNHPSGAPFSESDVGFAIEHGVEELRITHPWLNWPDYILRIDTDALKINDLEELILPYLAGTQETKYADIMHAIPQQERYTNENIHEGQVNAWRESYKILAETWPDWFEYVEVEYADSP